MHTKKYFIINNKNNKYNGDVVISTIRTKIIFDKGKILMTGMINVSKNIFPFSVHKEDLIDAPEEIKVTYELLECK